MTRRNIPFVRNSNIWLVRGYHFNAGQSYLASMRHTRSANNQPSNRADNHFADRQQLPATPRLKLSFRPAIGRKHPKQNWRKGPIIRAFLLFWVPGDEDVLVECMVGWLVENKQPTSQTTRRGTIGRRVGGGCDETM